MCTRLESGFICVTWPIHLCNINHSCVLRGSLKCVTWHINIYLTQDSFIFVTGVLLCMTWPIHRYVMTRAYVLHDSHCDKRWYVLGTMTHSYVRRSPLICMTQLLHILDTTQSYLWLALSCVWHDPDMCVTWLIHACCMTLTSVSGIITYSQVQKSPSKEMIFCKRDL